MESSVGGILVLAALTIAVVLVAGIMTSSTTMTGVAIQESTELVGERARTSLGQQANTTSTGKRLTIGALNAGITSISDYRNMDLVVEYQSNDTGAMVYKRLPYVTPAINFDAASDLASSVYTNALTFSHTVGSFSSRLLVVGAQAEASAGDQANCTVSSITYNGSPLTEIDEIKVTGGGSAYQCVGLWYLLTPDVGTHDVVITWAGSLKDRHGGAISMYNAAQQGPEATNKNALPSVTSISTSVTTLTDGAWLVDAVGSGKENAGFTALELGQTERYENGAGSSSAAGSTKVVPKPGSTIMGWSQAANRMAQVVAAFAVAGSATATQAPAPNEWVDRWRTPDTLQPEIWDPSETLTIRGILLPRQESGTTGTVTVSTPNGVTVTSTFSRPQWLALADTPKKVREGGRLATDGTYIFALRGGVKDFWRYNLIDEIDLVDNQWSSLAGAPANVRDGGALVYAEDAGIGYMFAFRGDGQRDFWRYDITNGTWDTTLDITPAPTGWGASLAWDSFDTMYAFRGDNTVDFWKYTISTDTWATAPGDPAGTVGAGGGLVHVLGDVYAFRGNNTPDFWCYCSGSWGVKNDAPGNVGGGGALAWDGLDYIYAWPGGGSAAFWRYSISGNSWEVLGPASTPSAVGEGGDLLYLDGDLYGLRGDGKSDFWTYQPRGY